MHALSWVRTDGALGILPRRLLRLMRAWVRGQPRLQRTAACGAAAASPAGGVQSLRCARVLVATDRASAWYREAMQRMRCVAAVLVDRAAARVGRERSAMSPRPPDEDALGRRTRVRPQRPPGPPVRTAPRIQQPPGTTRVDWRFLLTHEQFEKFERLRADGFTVADMVVTGMAVMTGEVKVVK